MRIPYVSPSRLKKALHCDFQYFLSYEWGWADELFTYSFSSEFGSAVHETLEEYAKSKGTIDYKEVYDKHMQELQPFADDMSQAPSRARGSFF
jgi:ATP-dependent helicase/DNAse subunit B